MASHTETANDSRHDKWGRRLIREGQAPHMVFGGFQIATADWVRTEDGWDCDYDIVSPVVYLTADECWAAIRGEQTVAVAA